jgi:hypothetical protein
MTLSDFADGYDYYGLHKVKDGWVFREWAPNYLKNLRNGVSIKSRKIYLNLKSEKPFPFP